MTTPSTVGRLFFAISMAAFGIQQLVTADFVRLVPPLPAWIPWHPFWAYLVGIILLAAGAAIGTRYMARWAAAVVGGLLILSILFLHLPKAATNPLVGFMWTNPCKALAMLGGVILVAGALPDDETGRSSALARLFRKLTPLGPLFLGWFLLLCGIQHFVYTDFVATLVPAWIPGTRFWVDFTGIALIAGGVGIILPKTRRLAALMSGIMILLWVVLLHIPRALAEPHIDGETAGVFEALALSGVAFILADRYLASVRSLFMAGTVAIAAIASGATVADAQERNDAVLADFAQAHVMTRNVYDGIDYKTLVNFDADPAGVLRDTLTAITGTDPSARAALHASQIAREHPDLLAIQEAVSVQVDGLTQVDMLSALEIELAKLGKPYEVIAVMKGLDTGSGNTIRFALFDAILVRSDLPPGDRVVNGRKQGLYKLSLNAGPLVGTFTASDPNDLTQKLNFHRNWMFVDMQLRGHTFRFVTTHLDVDTFSCDTQRQQVDELLEVVGNTGLPVIVAGDFNGEYENYPRLAAADYRDAWITGDGPPGPPADPCPSSHPRCATPECATWGEQDMKDPTPTRNRKIDLILLRGGVSATSARLVGDMAEPGQGSTLWASDHAGVVADLVFTSTINFRLVWLMIAIGTLLFAGLLLGVSRWLRRGRQ